MRRICSIPKLSLSVVRVTGSRGSTLVSCDGKRPLRLRIADLALIASAFGILASESVSAQGNLLAELRTQGNCFDCSPTQMPYSIGFDIFQAGGGGGWSLTATAGDVGTIFAAPTESLPGFNNALTHAGLVSGTMQCCHGDIGHITSSGLTNGTQQDKVMITRLAPVLGPNFSGYHVTNLTMTIDQLAWEPISSNRFRGATTYTARIYGVQIPPLPADFNVDSKVDAADYVTWRDRVADNDLMPNGVGTGIFQGRAVAADYNLWRANFGKSAFGQAVSIPEPSTITAFTLLIVFFLRVRIPRSERSPVRGCIESGVDF